MNFIINKNKWFLVFCFFLYSSHAHLIAQERQVPKKVFWQDVRFGGSLGLNFSDGYFNGFIAPKAVYDFNRYTSAGVGLAGSYNNTSSYSSYTVGASAIGLLRPVNLLQLSAEFEEHYVSRDFKRDGGNFSDSYWSPALFLGLGYTTGPVTVGIRYDVLHDSQKSIYGDAFMPFVSIYF